MLLVSHPVALGVGIITILTSFDTARPTSPYFSMGNFPEIQPVVVSRAFPRVYARLFDRVRMVRHSDERVVSVIGVVSNAATFETTVVRRSILCI